MTTKKVNDEVRSCMSVAHRTSSPLWGSDVCGG